MRLTALLFVILSVAPSSAQSDPRDVLRKCQALLERADKPGADATRASEADIARCRQVVRDWTLRDSRMLVDEHGKPLR